MRDLVGFRFGCSDFARSHSMTDVEGGELPFSGAALQTTCGVEADMQPTDTLLWSQLA